MNDETEKKEEIEYHAQVLLNQARDHAAANEIDEGIQNLVQREELVQNSLHTENNETKANVSIFFGRLYERKHQFSEAGEQYRKGFVLYQEERRKYFDANNKQEERRIVQKMILCLRLLHRLYRKEQHLEKASEMESLIASLEAQNSELQSHSSHKQEGEEEEEEDGEKVENFEQTEYPKSRSEMSSLDFVNNESNDYKFLQKAGSRPCQTCGAMAGILCFTRCCLGVGEVICDSTFEGVLCFTNCCLDLRDVVFGSLGSRDSFRAIENFLCCPCTTLHCTFT